MPRRSAAELQIVPIERHYKRIETPPALSGVEQELFERIVKQCAPMHFTEADSPLLVSYVQSIVLADMAYETALASPDNLPAWERCVKTMATLSVKLRLNPHSRVDPKTLARSIMRRDLGVDQETLARCRGWNPKA